MIEEVYVFRSAPLSVEDSETWVHVICRLRARTHEPAITDFLFHRSLAGDCKDYMLMFALCAG